MLEDARTMPRPPASPPRSLRLLRIALLGLGALALCPGEASADIFSYTDAEGGGHFANKPKGDGNYKILIKSADRHRPGVASVAPSDSSAERFTRYGEW